MYWTHCTFVKICTMVSHVFSRHWDPFCPMEDCKMPPLPQGSASEQKPPLSSLRKGRTWGACTLTRSQIFEELSKIQTTQNAITFWAGFHFANDLWLDGVFTFKVHGCPNFPGRSQRTASLEEALGVKGYLFGVTDKKYGEHRKVMERMSRY